MTAGAIIDQLPPGGGGGVADHTLTWDNWTVTLPGATDMALTSQKVSEIIGDLQINLTNMFADNVRRGIKRGMENFFNNVQWFEVETDLKIIAKRLGHSESFLQSYKCQKQCFQQSYLFSIADNRCFIIHGWATDIKSKFPTDHACLCAVLDDGLFVFDLVRDDPLLMFGAPVRRDFMERIEDIGSHGGLYAIDTMNYLKQQSYRDNNPDDLDTLLQVLHAKRLREKEQLEEQDEDEEDDAPEMEEDIGLSGSEKIVKIETLAKDFENAVSKKVWSSKYAIIDDSKHAEPIASVLLQVDKSARKRLTIQQIIVKGSFRRQGVAKRILDELKKACVRTGRVAHVQSASGDGMKELLLYSGFNGVEHCSFDYVWEWNANNPLEESEEEDTRNVRRRVSRFRIQE